MLHLDSHILKIIQAAQARRVGKLPLGTDCYRLVDSSADGCPGLWIDDLAGRLLIQTRADLSLFPELLAKLADQLGVKSIYHKRLDQNQKQSPVYLWGQKQEQPFVGLENTVQYYLDFNSGYSQGLFLDQRDNRKRVQESVKSAPGAAEFKVLNLFAYTGGFSLVAALGGAVTTSIDLSPVYLDWGKRNFQLNGLDSHVHYFVKGDVFDWLQAFAKKSYAWQGIIIDPPTFSRGSTKKVFRVETDYTELVRLACQVLDPGGWLLCCANTVSLRDNQLEEQIQAGVQQSGRQIKSWQDLPMPFDFVDKQYLKSFWVYAD
ncbi:MAG TPA: class I SAM-dependent rRNA methyltransferase [Candidatus Wirthbacteria bacterium]|nr:class I SAM-dependent rRNA methyltransferase [Candidatus Wirthbacteria bacterium]